MENLVSFPKQLAIVVRNHRRLLKLSQTEAARRVGLQTKTISSIENQPEAVTLSSFYKLLAALDLELVIRPRNQPLDVEIEW